MDFIFQTKCKSQYLRVIALCVAKGIQYKGYMDDYRCYFEIRYHNDAEIHFDSYDVMFVGKEIVNTNKLKGVY